MFNSSRSANRYKSQQISKRYNNKHRKLTHKKLDEIKQCIIDKKKLKKCNRLSTQYNLSILMKYHQFSSLQYFDSMCSLNCHYCNIDTYEYHKSQSIANIHHRRIHSGKRKRQYRKKLPSKYFPKLLKKPPRQITSEICNKTVTIKMKFWLRGKPVDLKIPDWPSESYGCTKPKRNARYQQGYLNYAEMSFYHETELLNKMNIIPCVTRKTKNRFGHIKKYLVASQDCWINDWRGTMSKLSQQCLDLIKPSKWNLSELRWEEYPFMTAKNESIKTILQTEIVELQETPDLIGIIIDFLAQNELYYTESECIIKDVSILDNRKMTTLINDVKKMKKVSQQYVETIDGEKIILQRRSYAIDVNKFGSKILKKIKLRWLYCADDTTGFYETWYELGYQLDN